MKTSLVLTGLNVFPGVYLLLFLPLSYVQLFETPWTIAGRLLCLWNSPGKNIGVDYHFLFQGIFPTQGSNSHLLCLLHCRQILNHWAARETLSLRQRWCLSLLLHPLCPLSLLPLPSPPLSSSFFFVVHIITFSSIVFQCLQIIFDPQSYLLSLCF